MKTMFIHGPSGSGKTRYSEEFAKIYGCTSVIDGWPYPSSEIVPGALHLTNEHDLMLKAIRAHSELAVSVRSISRALKDLENTK